MQDEKVAVKITDLCLLKLVCERIFFFDSRTYLFSSLFSFHSLYYIILHCTVLYCTVLYCTVLYCTVSCILYRTDCCVVRALGNTESLQGWRIQVIKRTGGLTQGNFYEIIIPAILTNTFVYYYCHYYYA